MTLRLRLCQARKKGRLRSDDEDDEDDEDEEPLKVKDIIRADDNTVVKKGVYGEIVSIERDGKFGMVRWELANGGLTLDAPVHKPERIALEGRFKYIVEDPTELPPIALRSDLGAVASLHGKPLFKSSEHAIDRSSCVLTHVVPDLGLLQSGNFIKRQCGFESAYIYSSPVNEIVRKVHPKVRGSVNENLPPTRPSARTHTRTHARAR
jgi:hypothetical protein